jgi:hypothetical protein
MPLPHRTRVSVRRDRLRPSSLCADSLPWAAVEALSRNFIIYSNQAFYSMPSDDQWLTWRSAQSLYSS